jgi:hypothetical protein
LHLMKDGSNTYFFIIMQCIPILQIKWLTWFMIFYNPDFLSFWWWERLCKVQNVSMPTCEWYDKLKSLLWCCKA